MWSLERAARARAPTRRSARRWQRPYVGAVSRDDPFATVEIAGARRSLVALGGTLDAPTLVSAYRAGCFPWPSSGEDAKELERTARRLVRRGEVPLLPGEDGLVPWCSPEPRAVLLPDGIVVRRSLRTRLRSCGWLSTVDTAFDDVVAGCADRAEGTWITPRMQQAYSELHRAGGAHSVEIWQGPALVGGLYGVLVGQVFCGESMVHRASDASKVALVELGTRLGAGGVRLIDVQEETPHLASMGQVLMHRADYLSVLATLRDRPGRLEPGRLPVARLAPLRG